VSSIGCGAICSCYKNPKPKHRNATQGYLNYQMLFLKNLISVFFFLSCFLSLSGQDIRLSQFQLSPLMLNPATTGNHEGKVRILSSVRNQWSALAGDDSHKIYVLSADSKKQFGDNFFGGLGISGHQDIAGELDFKRTQGNISLAFGKFLRRDSLVQHRLSIGGQLGLAQRAIDLNNARWLEQWDREDWSWGEGIPAPDLPGFRPDFIHADVSIGLLWSSNFQGNKSFYIGAAIHHLNQANISFHQGKTGENLSMRHAFHGGAELPVSSFFMIPSFIYQQQGIHKELSLGTSLKYANPIKNSNSYSMGIFYRLGGSVSRGLQSDALIFTVEWRIRKWTLGAAYDYSISELKDIGIKTAAAEMTLGYTFENRVASNKNSFRLDSSRKKE